MFLSVAKRLIQGYLIGMANIIPGVSGGTLALVLGIYPRLLKALSNMDGEALRCLVRALTLRPGWRSGLVRTLRRIDVMFLMLLAVGAVFAVFSLSRLITYLLHGHLAPTYAFFFGLIVVSIVFPYRLMRRFGLPELCVCLATAAAAVVLPWSVDTESVLERALRKAQPQAASQQETVVSPDADAGEQGAAVSRVILRIPAARDAAHIFAGAALAIAAMILPGVSGSWILLLLGVYFNLLRAVDDRDLILLAVFMAGGMFGLLVLARVVNASLRRYYDATMAAMIGLMCGSLWSLWPFKRYVIVGGDLVILGNRWPAQYTEILIALAASVAAAALVYGVLWLERINPLKPESSGP